MQESSSLANPLTRIPTIQRILAFATTSTKHLLQFSTVSEPFQDCCHNYAEAIVDPTGGVKPSLVLPSPMGSTTMRQQPDDDTHHSSRSTSSSSSYRDISQKSDKGDLLFNRVLCSHGIEWLVDLYLKIYGGLHDYDAPRSLSLTSREDDDHHHDGMDHRVENINNVQVMLNVILKNAAARKESCVSVAVKNNKLQVLRSLLSFIQAAHEAVLKRNATLTSGASSALDSSSLYTSTIGTAGENTWSPLHVACFAANDSRFEAVRLLVQHIQRTQRLNRVDDSPLERITGPLPPHKVLPHGAGFGRPLHLAVLSNSPNTVRFLLEVGNCNPHVSVGDSSHSALLSPFYWACRIGSADVVRVFLETTKRLSTAAPTPVPAAAAVVPCSAVLSTSNVLNGGVNAGWNGGAAVAPTAAAIGAMKGTFDPLLVACTAESYVSQMAKPDRGMRQAEVAKVLIEFGADPFKKHFVEPAMIATAQQRQQEKKKLLSSSSSSSSNVLCSNCTLPVFKLCYSLQGPLMRQNPTLWVQDSIGYLRVDILRFLLTSIESDFKNSNNNRNGPPNCFANLDQTLTDEETEEVGLFTALNVMSKRRGGMGFGSDLPQQILALLHEFASSSFCSSNNNCCSFDKRGRNGDTILHRACRCFGSEQQRQFTYKGAPLLQWIFDSGGRCLDPNAVNLNNETALAIAVCSLPHDLASTSVEVIEVLLANGCDPSFAPTNPSDGSAKLSPLRYCQVNNKLLFLEELQKAVRAKGFAVA